MAPEAWAYSGDCGKVVLGEPGTCGWVWGCWYWG